jgi:hypothetical protein
MLGKVARRVDQLLCKFERQLEAPILKVEVQLPGLTIGNAFLTAAPDHAGQRTGYVLRQPKRLADFPHRPTGAVARDGG